MEFTGQADAAYSELVNTGAIGAILVLAILGLTIVVVAVWRSLQLQINRQQDQLDSSTTYVRDTLHKALSESTAAIMECSASHAASRESNAKMADALVAELKNHDERVRERIDRIEVRPT